MPFLREPLRGLTPGSDPQAGLPGFWPRSWWRILEAFVCSWAGEGRDRRGSGDESPALAAFIFQRGGSDEPLLT